MLSSAVLNGESFCYWEACSQSRSARRGGGVEEAGRWGEGRSAATGIPQLQHAEASPSLPIRAPCLVHLQVSDHPAAGGSEGVRARKG